MGGLGGIVAEWLTSQSTYPKARLLRIGTADTFLHEASDQAHARIHFGLDANSIASKVLETFQSVVSCRPIDTRLESEQAKDVSSSVIRAEPES